MIRLSLLFLFAFFSSLLCGLSARIYALWTGGMGLWSIAALASVVVGLGVAWLLSSFASGRVGPKVCAGLCTLVAVLAFAAFGDTEGVVKAWTFLSMRMGLTYEAWHRFVLARALWWAAPIAFALPFLWKLNGVPRGRLTVFVGACLGLILARLLAGRVATVSLIDLCLVGTLLAAPLWLAVECSRRWAKSLSFALAALFLLGWYFLSNRTRLEPLASVNPFATIAARDSHYLGTGTAGVALREGRVVRAVGLDEASLFASQFIPTLLRPAAEARIAVRPQAGAPALPTYETGTLRGQYDALWVELPPAWLPEEADYFGAAALDAALSHLKDNGLLVYDLDARVLDARMIMERLGVLRAHLPHAQLWMTGVNRWQIVASRQPIAADFAAIVDLLDRPAVATALASVNLLSPVFLLPSCVSADPAAIEAALQDPIAPRIPRGEHRHARKLLFDGLGGQRLLADFANVYETEMPWVSVPEATATETRQVLLALREARRKAMLGDYRDASRGNPTDPFLLGLADRELRSARDLEKIAEHRQALEGYARAFALAQPSLPAVLEAATVARKAGRPDRAEPFYRLAGELAPEALPYLIQYADFLFEAKRYAEAEPLVRQVVEASRTPEDIAASRFFEARCIAHQKGREAEGLRMARLIAATVSTKEEKDRYIPAYGQLLIDVGRFVDGVGVKRHYQAYAELLPKERETGK